MTPIFDAFVLFLVMAVVALLAIWLLGSRSRDTESFLSWARFAVSAEHKRHLIHQATTTAQLDAAWEHWRKQGWSLDGLLYADLVKRRTEIVGRATPDEQKIIDRAASTRALAKNLPPVRGRGR